MGTKLRICALISVIINTCNVTGNRAGIQSLFLIHVLIEYMWDKCLTVFI